MIRFLADENFNRRIIRAVRRRNPQIDVVLAQDAGLGGVKDEILLAWAAERQMIILSHDRKTMVRYAWERVREDNPMTGLVIVSRKAPVLKAVEELLLISECSQPDEWNGVVHYVSPAGSP